MLIKLKRIKKKQPCSTGWKKHLGSLPKGYDIEKDFTTLEAVFESNGFTDFEWVMDYCTSDKAIKDFIERFAIRAIEVLVEDVELKLKLRDFLKNKNTIIGDIKKYCMYHDLVAGCIYELKAKNPDIDDMWDHVDKDIEEKAEEVIVHVLKHMPSERYYRKGVKK